MNQILVFFLSGALMCGVANSFPSNTDEQLTDIQSKRQAGDTSYSYAATDIGSKQGTHIKTITVIKNVAGKKDKPLKIDASLHQDAEWGRKVHDNFDAYGKIPEILDIDELFAFTKDVTAKPVRDEIPLPTSQKPAEIEVTTPKLTEKPKEILIEKMVKMTNNDPKLAEIKIDKIPDDVELIGAVMNSNLKSQSIHYEPPIQSSSSVKSAKIQLAPPLQNHYVMEYSTPQLSVRQYFLSSEPKKSSEYKKLPPFVNPLRGNTLPVYSPLPTNKNVPAPGGYNYSNNGPGNGQQTPFIVSTPSGNTFAISIPNTTTQMPYLAPSNVKKSQAKFNQPTGKPQTLGTSSQTPYIAPNIKKTYEIQLAKNNPDNILNNQAPNIFPDFNQTPPPSSQPNQTANNNNNINNNNNSNNNNVLPSVNLRIGSTKPISFNPMLRSRGLRY